MENQAQTANWFNNVTVTQVLVKENGWRRISFQTSVQKKTIHAITKDERTKAEVGDTVNALIKFTDRNVTYVNVIIKK